MEQFYHEENFGDLVVKTLDKKYYGFNLKCANECATAKKIIQDVNNFTVNGWKLQGTFQNGFIVTNHGMASLMKIAVERRAKKMIMRKTIVTMMSKRIIITRKKKRKGKRTRKRRRARRRKMRRTRRRKRKRMRKK
jgi:hypothetical protein